MRSILPDAGAFEYPMSLLFTASVLCVVAVMLAPCVVSVVAAVRGRQRP